MTSPRERGRFQRTTRAAETRASARSPLLAGPRAVDAGNGPGSSAGTRFAGAVRGALGVPAAGGPGRSACSRFAGSLATFFVLGISLSLPTPAGAQDGGVRSLFATGSGLRGLAMGGAQTAIARNTEALDWNPAGLGWAVRDEFSLGRTSYFGEGVIESQLAAVVPSWRWGGLGIGLRHIGVDGVEGRDARNQVTDSDFGASTLQFALGYGRSVGGWSFGSAFEVQREQVAGTGASGFGLDLGVQLRPLDAFLVTPDWMEGISVGVTWTNVIAPSLRLDEDTVVDPSGFRCGIGYERPFLSGGTLLAALDVETSEVTDPQIHTGVELRLHPVLALRSGIGQHGPTAGAGLHWNDFDLDYVLEDTELGSVHRVGLSYSFGRTTEERRMAYAVRQEEALQNRLEEASVRREEERILRLIDEAKRLRSVGHFDDAIATVDVARTLAPDYEEAIELEVLCWMDRAEDLASRENYTDAVLAYAHVLSLDPGRESALEAQARVQAESDRIAKRAESMRERFAAAMDAFGRGDLLTARGGFESLARENKRDTESQSMLARTVDAITRKANDHLEQSRRLIARNLLEEATQELEGARRLMPDLREIAKVEADLASRQAQTQARGADGSGDQAPAEAGRTGSPGVASASADGSDGRPGGSGAAPAASSSAGDGVPDVRTAGRTGAPARMDPSELNDLYRRGIESSQAERSEDAIRYFELVYSASPDYAQVAENLVREYLNLGMERFAKGDLDEAIDVWQRAIEVDPSDEKARGYLERALRHRSRSQEILGSSR